MKFGFHIWDPRREVQFKFWPPAVYKSGPKLLGRLNSDSGEVLVYFILVPRVVDFGKLPKLLRKDAV